MLSNKFKWVAGLALIIALILATNFIDKNNFKRIQDSVVSIYEDRLLAKDLIFDMQLELHQKELLIAQNKDSVYVKQRPASQKNIIASIEKFALTEITREEQKVFNKLEEELDVLFQLESRATTNEMNLSKINTQLTSINTTLSKLSDIQIKEGNRQMHIGKKAMESMELMTQMEIWVMLILAVIILFVILYSPKD